MLLSHYLFSTCLSCATRYTSDHGYHLGEWRIPAHKCQPYETDLRVPFLVRGPGVARNATLRRDAVVGLNVDIAPTIAAMAGVSPGPEARLDGRSLLPALLGLGAGAGAGAAAAAAAAAAAGAAAPPPPRTEFTFEYWGNDLRPEHPSPQLLKCGNPMGHWLDAKNNTWLGLRVLNGTHDLKYLQAEDDHNTTEFFDLAADPFELTNLMATPQGRARAAPLAAKLAAYRGCGLGPMGAATNTGATGVPCP